MCDSGAFCLSCCLAVCCVFLEIFWVAVAAQKCHFCPPTVGLLPSDCGTFAVGKCHIWTPKVPLLPSDCPQKAFQRPLSCPPVGRKCAFSVPDEEKTLRVFLDWKKGESRRLRCTNRHEICVIRMGNFRFLEKR